MPLVFDLRGFKELEQKLKELGNAISEDILESAVRTGAIVALKDAQQRAPRSEANKPHMADNLEAVTIIKDGSACIVEIKPKEKFFYGVFLERGTSKIEAQPFLRPAVDENRELISEVIADRIRVELKKITGR